MVGKKSWCSMVKKVDLNLSADEEKLLPLTFTRALLQYLDSQTRDNSKQNLGTNTKLRLVHTVHCTGEEMCTDPEVGLL